MKEALGRGEQRQGSNRRRRPLRPTRAGPAWLHSPPTEGPCQAPLVTGPRTLTGTRLPVTAEHVSLRTLTSKGSVRVDTGVFTAMVAQQAIIRPCRARRPGESAVSLSLIYLPPRTPKVMQSAPLLLRGMKSPKDIPHHLPEHRKGQRKERAVNHAPLQRPYFSPLLQSFSIEEKHRGDSLEQVLRSSLMRKPSEHWQT